MAATGQLVISGLKWGNNVKSFADPKADGSSVANISRFFRIPVRFTSLSVQVNMLKSCPCDQTKLNSISNLYFLILEQDHDYRFKCTWHDLCLLVLKVTEVLYAIVERRFYWNNKTTIYINSAFAALFVWACMNTDLSVSHFFNCKINMNTMAHGNADKAEWNICASITTQLGIIHLQSISSYRIHFYYNVWVKKQCCPLFNSCFLDKKTFWCGKMMDVLVFLG